MVRREAGGSQRHVRAGAPCRGRRQPLHRFTRHPGGQHVRELEAAALWQGAGERQRPQPRAAEDTEDVEPRPVLREPAVAVGTKRAPLQRVARLLERRQRLAEVDAARVRGELGH
eukprot:14030428-Alexandrium_andersonii.AAC.1